MVEQLLEQTRVNNEHALRRLDTFIDEEDKKISSDKKLRNIFGVISLGFIATSLITRYIFENDLVADRSGYSSVFSLMISGEYFSNISHRRQIINKYQELIRILNK